MSKSKLVTYIIRDVKALYPRINQPYRFDTTAGRSVPCEASEKDAKYELNFVMTETQARSLYNAMNAVFVTTEDRDDSWPDKLEMPFKKNEEGNWIGKSKIAASFKGIATKKPGQFGADNSALADDFMLTGGSVVHLAIELYPYKMPTSCGVSLRLRAVQVIDYVPYTPPSPFQKEEGFVSNATAFPPSESDSDDLFGVAEPAEEVEEEVIAPPVKRAKKGAKKVSPPASSKLSDIIDEWGADTAAEDA